MGAETIRRSGVQSGVLGTLPGMAQIQYRVNTTDQALRYETDGVFDFNVESDPDCFVDDLDGALTQLGYRRNKEWSEGFEWFIEYRLVYSYGVGTWLRHKETIPTMDYTTTSFTLFGRPITVNLPEEVPPGFEPPEYALVPVADLKRKDERFENVLADLRRTDAENSALIVQRVELAETLEQTRVLLDIGDKALAAKDKRFAEVLADVRQSDERLDKVLDGHAEERSELLDIIDDKSDRLRQATIESRKAQADLEAAFGIIGRLQGENLGNRLDLAKIRAIIKPVDDSKPLPF